MIPLPLPFLAITSSETGPPVLVFLILFPLFWTGACALSNSLLGIYSLFREYPADEGDIIEDALGWVQIEFGTFRGHTPMGLRFGRRALHLKGVFPFQPLFWLGPASIPWAEITQTRRIGEGWWRIWSSAHFFLGTRKIKLRGRAARVLQERLDGKASNIPQSIVPR